MQNTVPLTFLVRYANISGMDTNAINQSTHSKSTKESASLLSQVSLYFEYDKTIPQVRASLHKQPGAKK